MPYLGQMELAGHDIVKFWFPRQLVNSRERRMSAEHLVDQNAQRPKVGLFPVARALRSS
jgi:hypothetical protein